MCSHLGTGGWGGQSFLPPSLPPLPHTLDLYEMKGVAGRVSLPGAVAAARHLQTFCLASRLSQRQPLLLKGRREELLRQRPREAPTRLALMHGAGGGVFGAREGRCTDGPKQSLAASLAKALPGGKTLRLPPPSWSLILVLPPVSPEDNVGRWQSTGRRVYSHRF